MMLWCWKYGHLRGLIFLTRLNLSGRGGCSTGPVCGAEFAIVECLCVSLAFEDSSGGPGGPSGGGASHTSEEFTFDALSGGR